MDMRNMFFNPATIRLHENMMTVEWGDSTGSTQSLDSGATPKAMGGFTKSAGDFTWGLHYGNESNLVQLLRLTAESNAAGALNLLSQDNLLEAFFAGGDDMKWGVALGYSATEVEAATTKQDQSTASLRAGLHTDQWQAWLNLSLANEAENTTTGASDYEGKLGWNIGGSYNFGNLTPYLSYKAGEWEIKGDSVTNDAEFSELRLGLGNKMKVNGDDHIFTRIEYFRENVEVAYTGAAAEATRAFMPVVIGYESRVKDWLTLRGSVEHAVFGTNETKNLDSVPNPVAEAVYANRFLGSSTATTTGDREISTPNTTTVRAGASLTFGKLVIDGLIGTSGTGGTLSATDGGTASGIFSLDRFMSRVSATYNF